MQIRSVTCGLNIGFPVVTLLGVGEIRYRQRLQHIVGLHTKTSDLRQVLSLPTLYGGTTGFPVQRETLERVGEFGWAAREAFAAVDLPPQTVRLATQPFPEILAGQPVEKAVDFALGLEKLCRQYGLGYCYAGPVINFGHEAEV